MDAKLLEEFYICLLRDVLGTAEVAHSGRTLFKHLVGTHEILKGWSADDDIRLAGLFHSIYGTSNFNYRCLDSANPEHREIIVGMIGRRAETLVYKFCTLERPRVLLEADEKRIALPDLKELLEIEAANLLEQDASRKILTRLAQCKELRPVVRGALIKRLLPVQQDVQAQF